MLKYFQNWMLFLVCWLKCELANYLFSNSWVMRFVCARWEMRFTARSFDWNILSSFYYSRPYLLGLSHPTVITLRNQIKCISVWLCRKNLKQIVFWFATKIWKTSAYRVLVAKVVFVNRFEMKITNIIVLLTPRSKVLIVTLYARLTVKTSV